MTNDDPQEQATPETESVAPTEVVNEEALSAAEESDEADTEPSAEASAVEASAEEDQ